MGWRRTGGYVVKAAFYSTMDWLTDFEHLASGKLQQRQTIGGWQSQFVAGLECRRQNFLGNGRLVFLVLRGGLG